MSNYRPVSQLSFLTPDFCKGVSAVLTLAFAHKIYHLFQMPDIDLIEDTATKPLKHVGEDDRLTIFGFTSPDKVSNGILDLSPYVMRVEAYLRLAGIPYTKQVADLGNATPRGKAPYANVYGTMLDDSSKIIQYLKTTKKIDLDANLTDDQRALQRLLWNTLDGSFYWAAVHHKYLTKGGRIETLKSFQGMAPPLIQPLVNAMIVRSIVSYLHGQGTGRMPRADVVAKARKDSDALVQILGRNSYFLATDEPTSIDCDIYSWLVLAFYDPPFLVNPMFTKEDYPTLSAFVDRMKKKLKLGMID